MLRKARSGYALMMTVMFLAFLTVLATRMFYRVSSYNAFAGFVEHRERASILAYSGVQYMLATINSTLEKGGEAEEEQKEEAEQPKQKQKTPPEVLMLGLVLPMLNNWRPIESPTPIEERLPGEKILVYVSAEDGKFDINELFPVKPVKKEAGQEEKVEEKEVEKPASEAENKEKEQELEQQKAAKQPERQLFALLSRYVSGDNMAQQLKSYFTKRNLPLNETTELLDFKPFNYFVTHEFVSSKTVEQNAVNLTDLFTVWSGRKGVNPWYLSASVLRLLGIEKMHLDDTKKLQKLLQGYSNRFNPTTDWDKIFKELYGREWSTVKERAPLFAQELGLPVLSIMVEATVDSVTEKVFAILEPVETTYRVKKYYLL